MDRFSVFYTHRAPLTPPPPPLPLPLGPCHVLCALLPSSYKLENPPLIATVATEVFIYFFIVIIMTEG